MGNNSTYKLLGMIVELPGRVLVILVRLYQWLLSPLLGRHCRFEPSCSKYFIGAVQKYGAVRGTWRGIVRICRCHPWNPGGYDPP
ncbi:MAG: membrane protein insertion efficiency factor YidD [Thermoguttaceae bacterium]|jgi:putative membrane protein insertion efficiency factor